METSSIKTPFLGWVSVPSSFVSLFIFYILSYLPSKTMGCFSGRLMSAASDQKLFCEICSAFSCSFHEFVGEKVVSPSYSSSILAPPPGIPSLSELSTVCCDHTVKGFCVVKEAEVDVFLEFCCIFHDPVDIVNLISGSSALAY